MSCRFSYDGKHHYSSAWSAKPSRFTMIKKLGGFRVLQFWVHCDCCLRRTLVKMDERSRTILIKEM